MNDTLQRSIAALAITATLAGCGQRTLTGSIEHPITTAANTCGINPGDGTLAFNTQGNDDTTGDPIADIACVLDNLGVSEAIIARIDTTNALAGQQTAELAAATLVWSYHPDNGLFMSIEPS